MKMNKIKWVPLYDVCRGRLVERTVYGAFSMVRQEVGAKNRFFQWSLNNLDPLIFGRSLMKPFQMKPLVADLQEDLSWEEKALAISSHNGDSKHLNLLNRLLARSVDPMALQLPESLPMGAGASMGTKSRLNHPCSGKHLAILRACHRHSWNVDSYLHPEHQFNKKYLSFLKGKLSEYNHCLGYPDRNKDGMFEFQVIEPDGCGLPTVGLKMSELAFLFCKLAEDADKDWIWEAAHRHPDLIGGDGRVDTRILESSSLLFAKEGADGLLGISIKESTPTGKSFMGLVIKLAAGYDLSVLGTLGHFALNRLGFTVPAPSPLQGQQIFFNEEFLNWPISADSI